MATYRRICARSAAGEIRLGAMLTSASARSVRPAARTVANHDAHVERPDLYLDDGSKRVDRCPACPASVQPGVHLIGGTSGGLG